MPPIPPVVADDVVEEALDVVTLVLALVDFDDVLAPDVVVPPPPAPAPVASSSPQAATEATPTIIHAAIQ